MKGEYEIMIDGKTYDIPEKVWKLNLNISKERDRLRIILKELLDEADDLMEYCVDRGYLDPQDDSIEGIQTFNKAREKAIKELK